MSLVEISKRSNLVKSKDRMCINKSKQRELLPSLRPARRFPLNRVWQRSKGSRGNGEEGRSYQNKRHFSFDTVERTHARAYPPLNCDFSLCFVFCVLICSSANRQRTLILYSRVLYRFCFYRPATGEIIGFFRAASRQLATC